MAKKKKTPLRDKAKRAIARGENLAGKKKHGSRTTFSDRRGQEQEFNLRKEKRKR